MSQPTEQRLAELRVVAPTGSPEPSNEVPGADPDNRARESRASTSTRTRGARKISLDDEFVIEGKLEKPSAYYILRRSTVDYDWARLDARFSPLVLESVQDPLF